MNKKLYTASLLIAILSMPFLYNDAISKKTDGQNTPLLPLSERQKPSTAVKNIFYSKQIVEEVKPVHMANNELRYIMESGNVKNIQNATKKVITAINNLKNPDLKMKLKPALHFLTLMSTATTYQQMRTGYHMVKEAINPIHNKNRLVTYPYLVLNPANVAEVRKLEATMPALNKALMESPVRIVNQKIDTVLTAVKNVKNVPLQAYLDDVTQALMNMKKAPTILTKLAYQVEVIHSVNRILSICTEQK